MSLRTLPFAAVLAAAALAAPVAWSSGSTLPPNWHIHDGQTQLGPQHKGVGFFPAILGESLADYQLDPAACPNATDKDFLPSADESTTELVRAGVCMTSTQVIHLYTVPADSNVAGPAGWSSRVDGGQITYYLVTSR